MWLVSRPKFWSHLREWFIPLCAECSECSWRNPSVFTSLKFSFWTCLISLLSTSEQRVSANNNRKIKRTQRRAFAWILNEDYMGNSQGWKVWGKMGAGKVIRAIRWRTRDAGKASCSRKIKKQIWRSFCSLLIYLSDFYLRCFGLL